MDVRVVKNPLVSFELFYIILNIFNSLSHTFELGDLFLHLLASDERNLRNNTHNLGREIILQVDYRVVKLFIASDPKACFPNLLLERVVFEILDA